MCATGSGPVRPPPARPDTTSRSRMTTRTAEPTNAVSLDLAGAASQPVDEVLARLASSEAGLSESEAVARLARFGPNALPTRPVTALGILLGQLRNPLLVLLVGAAVVSAFTGGLTDAAIIAAIMLLSV